MKWLKRNEMDENRWNDLIASHPSSLPYAHTWYLDAVCERWDALVYGDYEAVMPLPIAKKWGIIPFVYQPNFCQQLGVFSLTNDEKTLHQFYQQLKRSFPFFHVQQNSFNALKGMKKKINFELNLAKTEDELTAEFNTNTKRNIQKAIKGNFVFSAQKYSVEQFVQFYNQHLSNPQTQVVAGLLEVLDKNGLLQIYAIENEFGELLALNAMIYTAHKIIHLIPVTNNEGRKSGAMHYLLSEVIKQNVGSQKTLDFEGSSIASIAQFYKGFGAQETFFYEEKGGFFTL